MLCAHTSSSASYEMYQQNNCWLLLLKKIFIFKLPFLKINLSLSIEY